MSAPLGIAVVPIDNPDRIPEVLEKHRDRELVVLVVGPADLCTAVAFGVSAFLAEPKRSEDHHFDAACEECRLRARGYTGG